MGLMVLIFVEILPQLANLIVKKMLYHGEKKKGKKNLIMKKLSQGIKNLNKKFNKKKESYFDNCNLYH